VRSALLSSQQKCKPLSFGRIWNGGNGAEIQHDAWPRVREPKAAAAHKGEHIVVWGPASSWRVLNKLVGMMSTA
jgi:hypothetical protein